MSEQNYNKNAIIVCGLSSWTDPWFFFLPVLKLLLVLKPICIAHKRKEKLNIFVYILFGNTYDFDRQNGANATIAGYQLRLLSVLAFK